jgi:hypothetical protein
MRLTQDGKLHIGTTGDGGAKMNTNVTPNEPYRLFVKGGIMTQAITVTSSATGFPDYVFANDYNLKSLPMVEAYINAHKHLENMPTATEVAENGMDLGELTRLQQEKIEELYLHLIAMDKRMQALEESNAALREAKTQKTSKKTTRDNALIVIKPKK